MPEAGVADRAGEGGAGCVVTSAGCAVPSTKDSGLEIKTAGPIGGFAAFRIKVRRPETDRGHSPR